MLFHDSRRPFYRSPGGAQPCGGRLLLRVLADPQPEYLQLRAWVEGKETVYPLRDAKGGVYEIELMLPDRPCLWWYYFIARVAGETLYLGNAEDNLGGEGAQYRREPPSFQVTVYDPAYKTPVWMRESVIYQIMVDRFRASKPLCARVPPERGHLHARWDEEPELNLSADGDNAADDFYGGDLAGVTEKLPYLKSLGVGAIYLNPVFRSPSNHKYNTGDYETIDPGFGAAADFTLLCQRAKELGIRVLLDGVFSHTGSDSRYFNKLGGYDSLGAYQSEDSPYASWYSFKKWPDEYDAWWGFPTLPNVNEMSESFLNYIIRDEDAIAARWLRAGASGWRLDVADELPMQFMRLLRERVKRTDPEDALLGEVWEDASKKVAYGELRAYCLGDTLDSCMNYPLRAALIAFLVDGLDAAGFKRRLDSQWENYPAPFLYSLMNLLGSHDKPRILSVLGGEKDLEPPREQRRSVKLSEAARALGRERLLRAWRFLCALPGMPAIYYGDEAGMEGMSDPFCRGGYPWGAEDETLLNGFREIALERGASGLLKTGFARLYAPHPDVICCLRYAREGLNAFGSPVSDDKKARLVVLSRAAEDIEICLGPDDLLPEPLKQKVVGLGGQPA